MALPAIIGGAVKIAPWAIGYFITDKVADTINPSPNGESKSFENDSDFLRIIEAQTAIPSLGKNNFLGIPSASNTGFEETFNFANIVKLGMLAGIVYVGFKALNEGKRLV